MYCSINQVVGIWDELRDAMEGKNGFGGDTAEIYAYRLMPNSPSQVLTREGNKEDIVRASKSLVEIIDMFRETYGGNFLINGINYRQWQKKYGQTFDHRVHVQFKKNRKNK